MNLILDGVDINTIPSELDEALEEVWVARTSAAVFKDIISITAPFLADAPKKIPELTKGYTKMVLKDYPDEVRHLTGEPEQDNEAAAKKLYAEVFGQQ